MNKESLESIKAQLLDNEQMTRESIPDLSPADIGIGWLVAVKKFVADGILSEEEGEELRKLSAKFTAWNYGIRMGLFDEDNFDEDS